MTNAAILKNIGLSNKSEWVQKCKSFTANTSKQIISKYQLNTTLDIEEVLWWLASWIEMIKNHELRKKINTEINILKKKVRVITRQLEIEDSHANFHKMELMNEKNTLEYEIKRLILKKNWATFSSKYKEESSGEKLKYILTETTTIEEVEKLIPTPKGGPKKSQNIRMIGELLSIYLQYRVQDSVKPKLPKCHFNTYENKYEGDFYDFMLDITNFLSNIGYKLEATNNTLGNYGATILSQKRKL